MSLSEDQIAEVKQLCPNVQLHEEAGCAYLLLPGLNFPNGLALFNGSIYVANENTPSITVYPVTATGNIAPTITITGAATGLSEAHAVALDSAGKIYVTNGTGNSVVVYAANATGNASPTVTIAGAATTINHPNGIAIDSSGKIYVGNNNVPSVTIFAAGATGNVAPVATISGAATAIGDIHGVDIH